MSEVEPQPQEPRSPSLSEQVDLVCDQFEAALRTSHQPQIEEFLAAFPEAGRMALLPELVALELDFQVKHGGTIAFGPYYRRFPTAAPILDALQAERNGHDFVGAIEVQAPVTADIDVQTIAWPKAPPRRRRIKHFELLSLLGEGGFGTVWRAKDMRLQRDVAIKIPRKDRIAATDLAFFLREARAAAKLHHPNIVAIHEVGEDESSAFIVSDLVDGVSLKSWIEATRLSSTEAAILVGKLASAAHHAHERGIVHRDLKPANVLLDQKGEPHVADFGLAKRETGDDSLAIENQLVGTPAYMSPEQANADHKAIDRRSDVYSLGAIFYELLTGQRVFRGELSMLLHQIQHAAPTPPRKVQPSVPRELEAICLKCLEKNRDKRYATAQELADDLHLFVGGETLRGIPTAIPNRVQKWIRRNRRFVLATILVTAVAVILTGSLEWVYREGSTPTHLRMVEFTTDPSGCEITAVAIDPNTGEPDPTNIQHATGRTPLTMRLVPGNYLIVAVLEEKWFHEVYRHVPLYGERNEPGTFPHQQASGVNPSGAVISRVIQIPRPDVILGMGFVQGTDRLVLPESPASGTPRSWHIPPFYVDARELTVSEFKATALANLKPVESAFGSSALLLFNPALAALEKAGKRLPSAAELYYLSTVVCPEPINSAVTPEANAPHVPCMLPDRTQIEGLHSGVLEWTTSHPDAPFTGMPHTKTLSDYAQLRVVGSGQKWSLDDPKTSTPRFTIQSENDPQPATGARGVRSAKPRRTPQDFMAPTSNATRQ